MQLLGGVEACGYHALLSSSHYVDQSSQAAQAAVEGCKVARGTVYRALRVMEQQMK